MKNPKEKLAFIFGVILYVGVLRALKLDCPIKAILSVPCLGCGMTRAVFSLLRFDFLQALSFHPLVFLLPLLFFYFLFDGRIFGKKADTALLSAVGAAFLLVWVLRIVGILPCP